MIKTLLFPVFLFIFFSSYSQEHGFPFGQVTYRELQMQVYDKDTSASAVVLKEFGEAYMDNGGNYNLIFKYHGRIKILKKSGLQYADIEIPLWKQDGRYELLNSVKASSFNIRNGSIGETKLDFKNIFTENRNKFQDIKKFAIPNVQVGSVIEFEYTMESPFIWKFRNWEFQSDIPKIYSEYWATIPANYIYNMTLKGFLKLSKNENEVIRDCYAPGGNRADCARYKFAMEYIPAFIEEDYMTARSNFLSAINFELAEIRYFDGRVDKVTKEWKDAEEELERHPDFGAQLRRGEDIMDKQITAVVAGETDPLQKARKIYDFIKGWYQWDEVFSKYSESGIKKAFEKKRGNVGDINLSLIASMRFAGLDVEPVILSTRDNGVPIDLHPVLSDFNYVVAKINIGDKAYMADATDDFLPFGLLPERCLNGKGRVLAEKGSYWMDLKPSDRSRQLSVLSLKLSEDGMMTGTVQTTFMGYEAVHQRKKVHSFNNEEEYIEDIGNSLDRIHIKNFEMQNVDNLDKPLVRKLEIEIEVYNNTDVKNFLFNPFVLGKWEENPFKSDERLYPVDFATPMEFITIMNMEYPGDFEIVNLPQKIGLALPDAGGRYLFEVQNNGNKLSLNNALSINKTIFTSGEYPYLKELFARIIQAENGDIIFRKKT